MSATSTLVSGIAGRYATAVYELAADGGSVAEVERDLNALDAALALSPELRKMIASPIYSRAEQGAAMLAVARALGLGSTITNTLGLMAQKRRLFVLPKVIAGVRALAAAARGELTAEVTAAQPLTAEQEAALAAALQQAAGRQVGLRVTVDEGLIGGLVVRLGSRMIDTSIRSKLAKLHNAMREVG